MNVSLVFLWMTPPKQAGFITEMFVDAGLLEDLHVKLLHDSCISNGIYKSSDHFWMAFHINIVPILHSSAPHESGLKGSYSDGWLAKQAKSIAPIHERLLDFSYLGRLLSKTANYYVFETDGKRRFTRNDKDPEQRLMNYSDSAALEAHLVRAAEGLEAALVLWDGNYSDSILILGAVQEALIRLRWMESCRPKIASLHAAEFASEGEVFLEFKSHYSKHGHSSTPAFENRLKHIASELHRLGYRFDPSFGFPKGQAKPAKHEWQKIVVCPPSSSPAFGGKPHLLYVDLARDRNMIAHTLPNSWSHFVITDGEELYPVSRETLPGANMTSYVIPMFIDLMWALKLLRPTLDFDYEWWLLILYSCHHFEGVDYFH
ncbi:MAG: hypothetical protein H7Y17_14110 [Chlorobia bacterium]|nr:hypothetical protein [Fimbriimonadaceae bacterium]